MSAGVLYVVATPLGNLQDISPRAKEALAQSSIVYAEDTRRSRTLLAHLKLSVPLESLHEHNERERTDEIVRRLAGGQTISLVSDAGTPAVSDPGAHLVAAAAAAGHRISPIPGPSALAAALSVSGFEAASHDVRFVGFLPVKGSARRAALDLVAAHPGVVVLFEAPHRIADTLRELVALDATRQACWCRELTKLHEEVLHGTVETLAARAAGDVLGELTLVLGPVHRVVAEASEQSLDEALRKCLAAGLSARDAAHAVAALLGVAKKTAYQRCQQLTKTG